MVVFGRPKGYRGSYKQWLEDDVAPQVVFEVQLPGNRLTEMLHKLEFYDDYGVEEYYLYNPETRELLGWQRLEGRLRVIEPMVGWFSPRLGIRFEMDGSELRLLRPDGERFMTYLKLEQHRAHERAERIKVEQQMQQLAAKLREMGVDPDTVLKVQ